MAIEKTINLNVNTKGAQKEVKNLEKAVEGVNEEVKETSASTKQMGGALDSATGGAISKFNGLKGTLKGVITSFKSLRVAIIATGIGALLIAVTSLGQAFTRSEEGQNKFAKILGVIGSVVDNLLDLLADLGEGIINAFTNPIETIKDFANSIKTFVVDKITGTIDSIGLLGSAIKKVFSGDFKGALEDTKKGFKGLVDNSPYGIIRDGVKSATEAVKEFSKEVASDAENAANIADARAKAEKMARNLIVERAEAERKIAEIREKAADKENFTAAERIELLKEAGAISEDLANKESEVARIRLQAIELENSLAKSNKQALDDEANARAQVIQLETNRLRLQKALTAEVTTAIRENNAEQKALADQKAAEEKERLDQKLAEDKERLEEEKKLAQEKKLLADAEVQAVLSAELAKRQIQNATIDVATQGIGLLKNLAGDDVALQKALLIAENAAGIAKILTNTAVANAKSVAASPLTAGQPFVALNTIGAGIGIASTIAATAKGLQGLSKTGLDSGGGGGVSGGGAPAAPPAPPSFNIVGASDTNQLADAIGGQTQQPVQAFVVANDVTTAQSLENNIVEGATL